MDRPDGRAIPDLRPISFIPNVAPHASGSVLVSFGNTRVICAATVEESVPRWMKFQNVEGGWVSAEYSMLPYSTHGRKQRDINRGKLDGRSSEIQRLIGRSLRAVIDLKKLGKRTIWIDCDVLQADGGTRTASITGGCVAAAIAIEASYRFISAWLQRLIKHIERFIHLQVLRLVPVIARARLVLVKLESLGFIRGLILDKLIQQLRRRVRPHNHVAM